MPAVGVFSFFVFIFSLRTFLTLFFVLVVFFAFSLMKGTTEQDMNIFLKPKLTNYIF